MDKNSITGIVLIFLVLVVFSVVNQPSKEQIVQAKRHQDSIFQVEAERARQMQLDNQQITAADIIPDSLAQAEKRKQLENQLGIFSTAAQGDESFSILENNLIKLTLSNKGGSIYSVELKEYKTYDGQPLILFDGDNTQFGMNFFAQNRVIQTDHLYFNTSSPGAVRVSGQEVKKGDLGNEKHNADNPGESRSVSYRLEISPGTSMEYVYTLKHNSWLVGFDVKMNGMNNVVASNQPDINFQWSFDVPRQEKKSQFGEDRYTQIYYKFFEDDVDKLSSTKSEEKNLTRTKWIGLKQLFFTSTIIAEESFPSAQVRSTRMDTDERYLANFYTNISLPWNGKTQETYGMSFYFGPNHFQTLRQYKLDMESQVYLGYAIVRPVNRYLIIPVFNFLRDYVANFGIIILLLTVFIKLILFPFKIGRASCRVRV